MPNIPALDLRPQLLSIKDEVSAEAAAPVMSLPIWPETLLNTQTDIVNTLEKVLCDLN